MSHVVHQLNTTTQCRRDIASEMERYDSLPCYVLDRAFYAVGSVHRSHNRVLNVALGILYGRTLGESLAWNPSWGMSKRVPSI